MAVTRGQNFIKMTAAGDAITDTVQVQGFHFITAAVASISTGTVLSVKDGRSTAIEMFSVPLAAQSSYTIMLAKPTWYDGMELDVVPAGAEMTVFLV